MNLITELIKSYPNNLLLHSLVIGLTIASLSRGVKNIKDDPEYKYVVTGVMTFNIIMFLQFISRNNIFKNNTMLSKMGIDKSYKNYIITLFYLFVVYIVSPSVVIALINLDEIPYHELEIFMIIQGVITILTAFLLY